MGGGDFPWGWKRSQFPVRPAWAMTINKSQGQSFDKVVGWLSRPVFAHGQLYVLVSRPTRPRDGIRLCIEPHFSCRWVSFPTIHFAHA